jgi:hypothetical protein
MEIKDAEKKNCPAKPKVVVVVEDGLVQSVYSNMEDVEVEVIDKDSFTDEEQQAAKSDMDALELAVSQNRMYYVW